MEYAGTFDVAAKNLLGDLPEAADLTVDQRIAVAGMFAQLAIHDELVKLTTHNGYSRGL